MKRLLLVLGLCLVAGYLFFNRETPSHPPAAPQAQPPGENEYFVSPKGDDARDGRTPATAFATVQKGVDALPPGGVLTIAPGEYFGSVHREGLGSPDAETVIRAQTPGTVVLRGDQPVSGFRKAEGARFTYVADFDGAKEIQTLNEEDTLRIFHQAPNRGELEALPGAFYHDRKAGKLYLSTSDFRPPAEHTYTVSLLPTHGLRLGKPRRVRVEGLTLRGYNAARPLNRAGEDITWGIFLDHPQQSVIRDCRVFLNAGGIAIWGRGAATDGDNLIERCEAWGNSAPRFGLTDCGGISLLFSRGDVVKDSKAWLNRTYGIHMYGTGGEKPNADGTPARGNVFTGNLAWGNWCDFKVKTGTFSTEHRVESCTGLGPGIWSLSDAQVSNNLHLPEATGADLVAAWQKMPPLGGKALKEPPHPLRRDAVLALAQPPRLHSATATTANIEWFTTLPAQCEVAWGETPECTQRATLPAAPYGSFSLTGLKPGQRTFFKITSLSVPELLQGEYGKQTASLSEAPLSFTTAEHEAPARTFYVAPDGDDRRDGLTRATAWRTLAHAVRKVNAGDTLLLGGGGVFAERIFLPATGEEGRPITFAAVPGERPRLSGVDKAFNQGFVAFGKRHLRFDGLTFADFAFHPAQSWDALNSGEILLLECSDIRVTRCFFDGRNTYSARAINAVNTPRIEVENCVFTSKMSGALFLQNCPDVRIAHCVFARPLTASFVIANRRGQRAVLERNIFTDQLKVKAENNNSLLSLSLGKGVSLKDNVFFLRAFPAEKRNIAGERGKVLPLALLAEWIIDPLVADPVFAGATKLPGGREAPFSPDLLMNRELPLDFADFFATNPEVVARKIGLQPEAFHDFRSANE